MEIQRDLLREPVTRNPILLSAYFAIPMYRFAMFPTKLQRIVTIVEGRPMRSAFIREGAYGRRMLDPHRLGHPDFGGSVHA